MSPLPQAREPYPAALAQLSIASSTEGDKLDLFSRLRRHKFLFSGIFLLTLGLMGAIYAIVPRVFGGHASILLAIPEPLLGGIDPVVEQRQGDPADLESQALVLQSLNLLQRVASQPAIANLIERECRVRKREPLERLIEMFRSYRCGQYAADKAAGAQYLQGRLGVSENGLSRVITVGYNSPIPKAGQAIPNAVVDAYIAERLRDQMNSRLAAVSWLRSEIARVSKDLNKTEARIEAFHRQHGLVRAETAPLAAEQLTSVDHQLSIARAAQSAAAAQLTQLKGGAADAPETLKNTAISNIKQQLAIVSVEIGKLETWHGSAYPPLVALRHQQASLRAQLNFETARIDASLRQSYTAATAKVAALEQQLKDATQRVTADSEAKTEIASLQRHADVQRELYVNLSKKVDALEIERRVLSSNARAISYAQYPKAPAFPRKLPFALGGLMLAMVASVGTTLLLDRSDRTVRTRQSLERAAGVPVLSYIPALRQTNLASCRRVMTPGALQEAIRQLYAHSILVHDVERPRSILVSSALPRDGKTFVTLALAQFAARSGQKVLAIEGDLRRPDFRRGLSVDAATGGLSDYLRGEAAFEHILQPGGVPGLDVITAGKPTFDSTELISNGRMAHLLSSARSRYDLILIDSPPTEILADSYLLAKEVDGVLFCARWGTSDMRIVSEALQQLTRRGAHVLGLAVDRVAPRHLHLYERNTSYGLSYLPRLS